MTNQTVLEKINQRERQLLVNSYLYYEMNLNIISDNTFDKWAYELVKLIEEFPREFEQSKFSTGFKGFDGSSGYYLPYKDSSIVKVARHLAKWDNLKRG